MVPPSIARGRRSGSYCASPAKAPAQAVLLGKARNALAIHLEPMLCGDRAELARIRGADGSFEEVDHLLEVALKSRGRDHLEDASGLVACVPERVPLTPRLKIRSPGWP